METRGSSAGPSRSTASSSTASRNTTPIVAYSERREPMYVFENITILNFGKMFPSDEDVLLFFQDYGIVEERGANVRMCSCGSEFATESRPNLVGWRYKCKNKNGGCNASKSPLVNTWLGGAKVSLTDMLGMMLLFTENLMAQTTGANVTASERTVRDYYGFLRELCAWSYRAKMAPIGGYLPDGRPSVVQVDETFLRRKYNFGRSTWFERNKVQIFGGICHDTKAEFMFLVPRLNQEMLWPLMRQFILPGTIVHTDGAKVYESICAQSGIDYGFQFVHHQTVIHKHGQYTAPSTFVSNDEMDSDEEEEENERLLCTTNSIENRWRWIKPAIQKNHGESNPNELANCIYTSCYRTQNFGGGDERKSPGERLKILIDDIILRYPGPWAEGPERGFETISITVDGITYEI